MKPPKRKDKDAAPQWGGWLMGFVLFGALSLYGYRLFVDVRASSPDWKTRVHADFPGLNEAARLSTKQRTWLIQTANQEKCPCLCGHTVASCLKGDLSCPIRAQNIARVRELIEEAAKRPAL